VLKKGKICGEVKADLQYFPVNLPDNDEDGTIIPPQESSKFNRALKSRQQATNT
jgi:hypothetical protein